MKLTSFFLFILCLQVSAKGLGQTVTLKEKDAPLEKIFSEIRRQTGYEFLYTTQLLSGAKKVSVQVNNVPVSEALKICLKDQPLDFVIKENTIVITTRENTVVPNPPENNVPPPVDITGRITNEQGQPLSGASVIIKRTGHGDISNANGNFTLKNVNSDDILVISYVGYKQQKIKVGNITSFTIVMQVATDELDKVQIQAYGTTTRRLATGNIVTVTAAEIERQPVMNPLAALQGRVPGLVIEQNSGYASAPFKAEIRGRSVINPNLPSEPLYIIDGVPLTVLSLSTSNNYAVGSSGFIQNGFSTPAHGQSPFFSIDPADVESITVLKDADATAIYGSRGANGVIIINTKTGNPGRTKFDLNVYQGVSEVTGRYKMLNTQQYLKMRQEAFYNDSIAYGITPNAGNAYDLLNWNTSKYTDWQKYLWGRLGHTVDVQLSLSGGDKQTTFRLGGGYHRETSILSRSGADQRASVQFNLSHKSIDQRLNISFTSTYSYTQSNLIYLSVSPLLPPNAPDPFDANGHLNFNGWQPVPYLLNNFGSLLQPYLSKTGFLNSQLQLQYEVLKGLTFSSRLGYSTEHNSQVRIIPIVSQDPSMAPTGTSIFGNNNGANAIVEPQLEYQKNISRGKLNVLIGGSLQTVSQDGNIIEGDGYINDNLLRSISNAPSKTANDVTGQYKYAALFSRINYNWNNKYLLNLSARRDGSSRFGPGKQYGNFGAIGAAWIFTEEPWLKDHLNILSFGKLRGSYGITGSDLIGDYGYLTRWSASGVIPYQSSPAYIPLQHANPDLEWQSNRKLEVALDLGFFNDRLNMEVAHYRNKCGNQLINSRLPALTGFNNVYANFPAVIQNKGWEILLKGQVIYGKGISWAINFDIGINNNKLIAFPNLAQSPYASDYTIGKSLNISRLLHYTGVDPKTGQYTYEDKNHDGQLTTYYNDGNNDLYDKDLSVKFDGGFGTDIQYKRLQLNLFFAFRDQTLPSAVYASTPGDINNQPVQVLDRWQKVGDVAKYARFTTQPTDNDGYLSYSDGGYSNGSYIRLRNMSLSYDLPKQWVKRAKIPGCKVYLRGQNLFVITNYDGIDPDAAGFGVLPPAKIFTGGIQFNF